VSAIGSPAPRRGRVHLVGAGPGDPGLLTVRAVELLRAADVVAHDELVPAALLDVARPEAERLPVGRRCHGPSRDWERIHPDVLARARAGLRVVRLKAGDPFVFGRGGEEAEALREAGIPFDVTPGVSAALGAAASALIPLTHRDHSSDVTFATGHAAGPDGVRADWDRLAAAGTLVLYMGTRHLEANLAHLVRAGRSPATPAAWIASATRPEERVVVGTIGDLARRVAAERHEGPSLVVLGEVVALRAKIALSREEDGT